MRNIPVLLVGLVVGCVLSVEAQQDKKWGPLGIRLLNVDRPVTSFLVDLADDGFQLTSADKGVMFDVEGSGRAIRVGWTSATSDDGFLFLDTNGNGRVDSGLELIGDGLRKTDGLRVVSGDDALREIQHGIPLQPGPVPAELQHQAYVDAADEVFARLRLWRDRNHNGVSEPSELQTMAEVALQKIYLGFRFGRTVLPDGNTRLMVGTVHLEPSANCKPQPGMRCEVTRSLGEFEFAREGVTPLAAPATSRSLPSQQLATSARLVRAEGRVTLNGQPVAAGAAVITLGDAADLQTTTGRAVIALKQGGTFVLGEHTSARVHANGVYNFNRIEVLTGSAVVLSATSSPVVTCGTEARLSTGGVFRFDVLSAERMDGSQRCRVRVYEGGASTPGASVSYVLRDGQEMVMNTRAGDMIPVARFPVGALDELDKWAREQASLSR